MGLNIPKYASGHFRDGVPFLRIGQGTRRLVVLPGLGDALQDVHAVAWKNAWFYRNLGRQFTVYLISRKRHLPAGYSIRDMSLDCARVMEEYIGPAFLLGVSMGAFIAQELAIDFPHLVRRLVIAASSHRQGPNGRELGRRWSVWARQDRWHDVCRDFAAVTFHGLRRPFYRFILPALVRVRRQRPSHPSDFLVSIDACLRHDATERLAQIQVPTLVIGGDQDGFFPEPLIRETADRIPGAKLHIVKGSGHGLFMERTRLFNRLVCEFLEGGG